MQSIAGFLAGDKGKDRFTVLLIILVGFASFGLGRLSAIHENTPKIRLETPQTTPIESDIKPVQNQPKPELQASPASGSVVVSKHGEVYHAPWCSGAKRISEANKVWYDSEEAAKKAGYRPAANCKGLRR